MDPSTLVTQILVNDLLNSQRAFQMVTMQGLMNHQALMFQGIANHQTNAHLLDTLVSRDSVEVSFPEAAAMSNLSSGALPEKVAGLNTAYGVPVGQPVGTGK